MKTVAFDTTRDEELCRQISRKMAQKLTRALASIMRLHHAVTGDSPHTMCALCPERYPCRTWRLATGEDQ